ncbi:MAG: hypothetical protein Q9160_003089 [Pyrenula sp. 1 TL-2023]
MHPVIAVPAIIAIVYRAYSHKSLTPSGLAIATLTAIVHSLHPSSLPFTLLGVFFLAGTAATKVKHDIKSTLTLSSTTGSPASQAAPRNHIQVLANSGVAALLVLLSLNTRAARRECFSKASPDIFMVGIIANYAAVAADTFSSELGILSKTKPRLITTLQSVPPGTNGGVTFAGLIAGLGGAAIIAVPSLLLLDFCSGWGLGEKALLGLAIALWGALGSLLDSLLGALLQASVVDRRTGKIVEGEGGEKVLVSTSTQRTKAGAEAIHRDKSKDEGLHKRRDNGKTTESDNHESRTILSGMDIMDNNQINVLMATTMSLGAISVVKAFK